MMAYKALISQRQQIDKHGVFVDVLESTYVYFFETLDVILYPVSNFLNDIENFAETIKPDLIILSGGGEIKPNKDQIPNSYQQALRDSVEEKLINHALISKKPILGICRGMQHLNVIYGGKVDYLNKLTKARSIDEDHLITYSSGKEFYVNNYHNFGVYRCHLSNFFRSLAVDSENETIEAFYNKENLILGIQWHPERQFRRHKDYISSKNLVESFIERNGIVDESYYTSGR